LANIPEFIELILAYPIEFKKPRDYDYSDDLLCQFQVALMCLRADRKQTYLPKNFFRAFKENK